MIISYSQRDTHRKKLLYLSHPCGGSSDNITDAARIAREFVRLHSLAETYTLVSPLHCFGFMYNDVSYDDGLDMCLDLLSKCDAIAMCEGWEDSVGCTAEYKYAKLHDMPIYHINDIKNKEEK